MQASLQRNQHTVEVLNCSINNKLPWYGLDIVAVYRMPICQKCNFNCNQIMMLFALIKILYFLENLIIYTIELNKCKCTLFSHTYNTKHGLLSENKKEMMIFFTVWHSGEIDCFVLFKFSTSVRYPDDHC
jgi:hypothetical protein